MAFVILLYIMISWLANRNIKALHAAKPNMNKAKFKILGKVPRGFQHAGAPKMDTELLSAIAPDIPVTIIVLILEHISRVSCCWLHEPHWTFPRCLPCYRLVLKDCDQVESWCSHPTRWYLHSRHCSIGSIRPYSSILLHSYGHSCSDHHSRCR
jgi:hypothetical protein